VQAVALYNLSTTTRAVFFIIKKLRFLHFKTTSGHAGDQERQRAAPHAMSETSAALEAASDPNLNWEALESILGRMIAPPGNGGATDAALVAAAAAGLPALQAHLAARLPLEWSASIHHLDDGGGGGAGGGGSGGDDENAPPQQQHQQTGPAAKRPRASGRPQPQSQQQPSASQPLKSRRPRAPGLFASAAAVPGGGVYVFGGLGAPPGGGSAREAPQAQPDAWANEAGPMRQLPDQSRVLKTRTLGASPGVAYVGPPGLDVATCVAPGSSGGSAGAGEGAATGGAGAAAATAPEYEAEPTAGEAEAAEGSAAGGAAPGAALAAGPWRWRLGAPQPRLSCGLVGHAAAYYRGRIYLFGGQLDDKGADYARPKGGVRGRRHGGSGGGDSWHGPREWGARCAAPRFAGPQQW
jgi:hypothetical protein